MGSFAGRSSKQGLISLGEQMSTQFGQNASTMQVDEAWMECEIVHGRLQRSVQHMKSSQTTRPRTSMMDSFSGTSFPQCFWKRQTLHRMMIQQEEEINQRETGQSFPKGKKLVSGLF
jgi:hypothetical protein